MQTVLAATAVCGPSRNLLKEHTGALLTKAGIVHSMARPERPQSGLADRGGVECGAAEEMAVCSWRSSGSAVAEGLNADKEEDT